MSETITNTVQVHRSASKVTQEDLAQAVGVTRQTIIAIEKGNYTPSVLLALKIAKYFNTSVDTLFTINTKL
ncbi:helix-turn-helix transcriptional regulator [Candidatus Woesebacteria bacterium]|nr:helix-turn-helix transcriptional regulator [Candidatus Woesebacteria bacterium]